jgi:hypothetical protein
MVKEWFDGGLGGAKRQPSPEGQGQDIRDSLITGGEALDAGSVVPLALERFGTGFPAGPGSRLATGPFDRLREQPLRGLVSLTLKRPSFSGHTVALFYLLPGGVPGEDELLHDRMRHAAPGIGQRL